MELNRKRKTTIRVDCQMKIGQDILSKPKIKEYTTSYGGISNKYKQLIIHHPKFVKTLDELQPNPKIYYFPLVSYGPGLATDGINIVVPTQLTDIETTTKKFGKENVEFLHKIRLGRYDFERYDHKFSDWQHYAYIQGIYNVTLIKPLHRDNPELRLTFRNITQIWLTQYVTSRPLFDKSYLSSLTKIDKLSYDALRFLNETVEPNKSFAESFVKTVNPNIDNNEMINLVKAMKKMRE